MKQHEDAPKIDKVSDQEVWLLDENNERIRRICGKPRTAIPEEFPCTEDAGSGTAHEGEGYCLAHDMAIDLTPKTQNTYEILVQPKNKKSLLDYIVQTSISESEHHTSVDSEIELLEALIGKLVSEHAENLTAKMADDIAKVAQKLGNLKKIKIETLKKEKLDAEVISKFLRSILAIIKMHTSPTTAKQIVMDIITNVAVPMMNRDEMTKMDKGILEKVVDEPTPRRSAS